MLSIPPLQRRGLGATLLLGGLLVGLPRAWAALEPAPIRADPVALGGPQVRVLLREAPVLTLRAPAGGRLRLRDGAGQVLMELGPEQPLRLQLAGAQVLGLAEAGEGSGAPGAVVTPAPDLMAAPGPGASTTSSYRAARSPADRAPTPAPSPAFDSATGTPLASRPGSAALATGSAANLNPSSDLAAAAQAGVARPAPTVAQRLRVGELVVEPLPAAGTEGSVWLQKRRYRGSLWIRPQGEALQAVNLVGLETYLASVVGSEMPASWPLEALRAQAVAARTYALRALRPSSGRAYDLKATVASQMYLGVEAETASTQAAVAGTRGLVLTYGDGLIEAVFHSSAGGSTENSGELWAQQLPYLVSVPDFDNESPVRDWRLPLGDELVRKGLPEIGSLERIEVLSTSSSGRVRQARVVGSAGSLVLTGAELRSRLGLKSTLVQFVHEPINVPLLTDQAGTAVSQLAAATSGPALASTSGLNPSQAPAPQGVGGAGPAASAWATPAPLATASPAGKGAPPASLLGGPGTPSPTAPLLAPPPPPSGDGRAPMPRLQWVAIGHGFGHGIGMSQWGALAMARRGEGFEQILQHYYRGTQLRPYASLAALVPLLQPRLGLGPIPLRPP
ncbi:MAG: SpoIID/LytB domain-containing protein, partial [Synechococcus sp. ELA619]